MPNVNFNLIEAEQLQNLLASSKHLDAEDSKMLTDAQAVKDLMVNLVNEGFKQPAYDRQFNIDITVMSADGQRTASVRLYDLAQVVNDLHDLLSNLQAEML